MMRIRPVVMLPIIISIALLAAFALTSPAFAEDQPPQPETAPTEVVSISPEEVPAEVETLAVETPPVDSEKDSAPEEPPVELPVTTKLLVTNESGEITPLATEEAGEALETGDPWFKVGTTTYYFKFLGTCGSTPNCTESSTPIQAAVDYLRDHSLTPSDGLIHVETGTYTDNVVVDGNTYPILGNLKGLIAPVVNYLPSATINGGGISIRSCDYGFTLSGFSINSISNDFGIELYSCAGTVKFEDLQVKNQNVNGSSIYLATNGAIIVNRVKADDNAGAGAGIYGNYQSITITNSSFDHNNGSVVHFPGLDISTSGPITLDGVSASRNLGNEGGLQIVGGPGAITIKNSFFNNNSGGPGFRYIGENSKISLINVYANGNNLGINLSSSSDITLSSVHADSNNLYSANIDTCSVSGGICTKTGTGKVTIINSTFDNNGPTIAGLEITSRGAVTLSNVSSSGNNLNAANTSLGAIIHTDYSQSVSSVTITNCHFNQNDAGGLEVYAKGAITLTKVKANENALGHGAYLDNGDFGTASISILGSAYGDNEFSNNGVIGLSIYTKGKIVLNYATANGNQNVAVSLNNQSGVGSVTLKSGWFGNTSQPNLYGVNIVTNGAVTITGVFARGNDFGGLSIDQSGAIPQPIKITGGDFSDNGEQGLRIWSQGSITLANISVSNTGSEGINLVTEKPANITMTNCYISSTGDAVPSAGLHFMTAGNIVLNSVSSNNNSNDGLHIQVGSAGTPKSITITKGNFNGNLGDGLELFSTGAITLKNTNAYGNTGYGAHLDNTSGTAGITITNSALPEDIYELISPVDDDHDILKRDFSKNGSPGLWINSYGAVSVTSVIAGKNGGLGMYVINANPALAGYKSVTLKNMRIFENQSTGLEVYSEGPITLMDVFSWYHNLSDGSYGARLLNNMEGFKTPVTVKNTNGKSIYGFSVNRETSLYIRSYGIVTLEGVSANNCLDSGCRGININSSASNTIIKNTSTYGNNGGGLYIRTAGAIIVNGGSSSSNTGIGADLYNSYGLPSPISITNYGTSSNTSDGFQVVSNGNISLSNTSGYSNGGLGAVLDNNTCANCYIKLSGSWNVFSENTGSGLDINTHGAVSINNLGAGGNSSGLDLYTGASSVTITNSNATENNLYGMYIWIPGFISLNRVTASNNGDTGLALINLDDATGLRNVTITKCIANTNGNIGIEIQTYGAINGNNIEASGNGYKGLYLNNDFATAKGITILSTLGANIFNNNTDSGLEFYSRGNVVLNGITADANLGSFGIGGENNGNGTVILTNINTRSNNGNGMEIFANNTVSITNAMVVLNSKTTTGAGILVSNSAPNSFVKIINSVVSQNGAYGIRIDLNTGSILTLMGTFYYGNNFNGGGYPNLLIE